MLKPKEILKELNILYIEDEKIILENVTKTLELFVKRVVSCDNKNDALEIFENESVDIIISDIQLKDSSGIDFIRSIRRTDKKIPIILLTGYTDTKYLMAAVKLNLIEYVVKPIDLKQFKSVLYEAAEHILENNLLEIQFKNDATYNVKNNKLFNGSEIMEFTANELKFIELLLTNKGDYTSAESIKYHIWEDDFVTDNAFKSLINKTRKKVGKESIINLSGIGYKLELKN